MPTTTTDLYRRGNSAGPRLSHVRIGKDVLVFQINGVDWVAAHSGGVSTFISPGAGANWWALDAGYSYPDEITIINDHGNHFSWEPSFDLPLSEFIRILEGVEPAFRKVL
jgi:hypothetical protein